MNLKINFVSFNKDLPLPNIIRCNVAKSINPLYYFRFLRKNKVCNIFCYYYAATSLPVRLFNIMLCFLVRFPHGPAIITAVDEKITKKSRWMDEILFRYSNIIEVFSEDAKNNLKNNYEIEDKKITILDKNLSNLEEDYKKAFFIKECGHPSWIYDEKRQRERINWLKERSTGKKLEIGCATGYIINYVGGGTGLDLDEERLEFARLKYKTSTFVMADASKMSFPDKEFDSVLVPEILEHAPYEKAREIIDECRRVGKKLLVTVPNASKKNYDKKLVENPEHLWLPTKERMFELMGKDIQIEYTRKKDFMLITKLCA